jgi:hypothetical protein
MRWLPRTVVALTMLFQGLILHDELTLAVADTPTEVNDHILHAQLAERIAAGIGHGGALTDPWIPEWGQGFPVLRYYQHLPHLAVVAAAAIIPGLSRFETFKVVNLALLMLIPFAFALGARWLGMTAWSAAISGVFSVSLSVAPDFPYGLGIQTATFTWDGGGLFPQLFATVMAPLALGATVHAIVHGRREGRALLFLWLTWMSHLVLGYAVCMLAACVLVRQDLAGGRRGGSLRLAALYGVLCLAISALLLPSLLESPILSHSIWEDPVYWDSHGAGPVLSALASGRLLDGGQFPVLTTALGAGVIFAGWQAVRGGGPGTMARGGALFLVAALSVALVLFFGRNALGGLTASFLPFSENLPFHRFICAVQLVSVWLGALGLAALASQVFGMGRRLHRGVGVALATVLVGAVSSPGLLRANEAATKRREMREALLEASRREWPAAEAALDRVDAIRRARGGRAYGGASWDWGRNYVVGGIPMYLRWATHDIPAISYMFHTMGRMSDVETAFSPERRDHWELFDVRVMMTNRPETLPSFANIEGRFGPHIVASVDSEGPLGLVRSRYFIDTRRMTATDRFEFAKAFVASGWHAADEFPRVGWRAEDRPAKGEVLWATPTVFPPPVNVPNVRGKVEIASERDDALSAEVTLEEDAILLVRKTFHPAWQVRVDGREVTPVMLAPSFLGVPLGAGTHKVEIAYRGSAGYAVLWWVGPICVLFGVAWDWRRRRASTAAPAS